MRKHSCVAALGLVFCLAPGGQANDSAVVAFGYQLPTEISAAPGQLLTVLLHGIDAPQQRLSASAGRWPTTLGTISATLTAATQTGIQTLLLPIGSVFPFSNCAPTGGSTCETLTAVTLQIPFEMLGTSPSRSLVPPLPAAVLKVSDQSGHAATIFVAPLFDQIHVVKSFDTITGGEGGGDPAVTHANGSAVSSESPAKPGETLVMYAVGLGNTNPAVATGAPSPASPLTFVQEAFKLHYDFQPNSTPSPGVQAPSTGDPAPTPAPVFVGLSPGFVGLYQVNFVVIGPPQGTLPCRGPVVSNLTVTVVGSTSWDGAAICVDTSGN